MGKRIGWAWAILFWAATPVWAAEKPPVTWNPAASCNYTNISYNRGIQYVIIHTIEGSASSAISWFKNCASNVSAHYVVAYSGAITQMVADEDIAWHASNWNTHSIGIEHEGFAGQNYWTTSQYQKSAALTRWICLTYGVPMTRQRILGHNEVSSYKSDPGPYFNWDYYMSLVTNGSTPPTTSTTTARKSTTDGLNVRSGPGTGYSIIGSISLGQQYVSIASSSGWYKIYFKDNTGWCYDSYLATVTGVTGVKVAASSLNVRSGPGTGYGIIGSISSGQIYIRITTSNGWSKFYWGGTTGWSSSSYLTSVPF